jgi:hypothetical protein
MSKDLLREAIADAKAVKETAYANAKLALEEALAPHIQSMISAKLSEDLGDDVATESVNEENSEYGTDDMKKVKDITEESDSEKDEDKKKDESVSEAKDEDDKEDMKEGEEEDEDDMSDLDLEAIIRELEEELASSQIGQGDNKEPADVSSAADTEDPGKNDLMHAEGSDEYGNDEDKMKEGSRMIDLEELIRALREVDSEDDDEMHKEEYGNEDDEDKKKMESLQSDLTEAYEVITFLRNQINEINLLNAKLMYSTKLFKKFDLNESQKAKVIENLDRTKTIREAKLIYTTLAETFHSNKSKASTLKESFASDAIPSTKPSAQTTEILSGGNDVADRFKILAGLK